jgi:hypothetical protein
VIEKRREVRYAARIVARLGKGPNATELLTNNVSFRGVFIRTDAPPALRQLIRIELVLPNKELVVAHAMVVHVAKRPDGIPKGEGVVPGVGVQFWGPIDNARAWQAFIHELRQKEKEGTATSRATDKVRRASVRLKVMLEVSFDGKKAMTRDLSENGMALRTDVAMDPGSRTQIRLHAGAQAIVLDAIVRRVIQEPGFRGLGVELVEMTLEKRAALSRFIQAHAPPEERVFVPPGDPKLH